ncbi:threonine dehydratase [Prosthecobacter fusiformis]|uniref:Threonine dehydratase n=1 Tax=Prosthecobacter fusiformis TaxID=48464 RepID=A0A4R7RJI4_9BACT|nr:threonine ammonia-lyase [Prosthecobacter fusiformis]TDU64278.1 threonine dehydratase [Prosthecobacter fusiformis]
MKAAPDCTVSLSEIMAARLRLNGAIARTPCVESAALSELTGARIFCKQEHLQRTGSFKERGARNALAQLTPEQSSRGVIAASAGNHALGLSWHGRALGIPVTVVMPRFAPLVKLARCRQFGATVVLHGDTFDEARSEATRLAEEKKLTYVHPFDDPQVIAGQGTLAFEILEQVPDAEAIIVPVGGGGLLAGVATVLQALKPDLQIIGVEPANAACFAAGLASDGPVRISTRYTLADGLAVAEAGRNTLAIARPLVNRMVMVGEEELALAMLRLAELDKCVIEGAGAAGLAAFLGGHLPDLTGRRVVVLLTGGNIDPLAHSRVIERGLAADGRIYRFDVLLSDRPGGLAHLSAVLAAAGANVTEIVHNRTFSGPDLSRVHVLCTIETRDRAHIAEVQQRLADNGVEIAQADRSILPK